VYQGVVVIKNKQ